MRKNIWISLFVIVLCGASIYYVQIYGIAEVSRVAEDHWFIGILLVGLVMFVATVIAPLSTLPLVPVFTLVLGPFKTGIASYIGWLLGAIVIFYIGRHLGRPFIARFINVDALSKYEHYVRPDIGILLLIILRITVPVDVLSYILSIFTTISFRVYVVTTAIGISWFSFAFPYFGAAFFNGQYVLLASIGVASTLILVVSWMYIKKSTTRPK